MKKLKSLLQKTRKVTLFVWNSVQKNTPLSSQNYWCWYLQHWGWAIYKVFDSHATDIYSNGSHSERTCVLLEIPSIYTLVQYFHSLYKNKDLYELEGVHIPNFEVDHFSSSIEYCSISNVNSYQCSCKHCRLLRVLLCYRNTLYNVMRTKRHIARRSSSKCHYQCSRDQPYSPGCNHWCPVLQFGWDQVCVEYQDFVVDWNTLHRLCGSANK